MSLDNFFDGPATDIKEKIKQRRSQMLIHSCIYYEMDDNLVSDEKWQQWADELTELQKECQDIGFYDSEFYDWNGSTGSHLPHRDPWVYGKALQLIRQQEGKKK